MRALPLLLLAGTPAVATSPPFYGFSECVNNTRSLFFYADKAATCADDPALTMLRTSASRRCASTLPPLPLTPALLSVHHLLRAQRPFTDCAATCRATAASSSAPSACALVYSGCCDGVTS